jgi:hypothetical protein
MAGGLVALGLVGTWIFLHVLGGALAWVARRQDRRES